MYVRVWVCVCVFFLIVLFVIFNLILFVSSFLGFSVRFRVIGSNLHPLDQNLLSYSLAWARQGEKQKTRDEC